MWEGGCHLSTDTQVACSHLPVTWLHVACSPLPLVSLPLVSLPLVYLPRYMNHADILAQYDAIMVLDDDIEIEGTGINRLFELREEFNLWAIAPSFKQPYVEREEEEKKRRREEEKKRRREEERGRSTQCILCVAVYGGVVCTVHVILIQYMFPLYSSLLLSLSFFLSPSSSPSVSLLLPLRYAFNFYALERHFPANRLRFVDLLEVNTPLVREIGLHSYVLPAHVLVYACALV